MERSEYDSQIQRLADGLDLSAEAGCKRAYTRCVEYAQEKLYYDPAANDFLAYAAERMNLPRAHLDLYKGRTYLPEMARLHLAYTESGGPVLTGTPDGLRYLAALCEQLATAVAANEHIHLYAEEAPMFGNSFGLTIYNEPPEWFDRYAVSAEDESLTDDERAETDAPPRELAPSDIAALRFAVPIPPQALLTLGKIYRVLDCYPYEGKDALYKVFREDGDYSRVFVFVLWNDGEATVKAALHLDDDEVTYFTRSEMAQFLTEG